MIPSKNNDIGNLVEQIRQRDVNNRERKGFLVSIEAALEKVPDLEALGVKWIYFLDNVVWPVFSKHDRTDLKSIAGRILRRVGILLFDSPFYPEFLIWMGTLHQSASRKHDDGRADIVYSVSNIIETIGNKAENRLVATDDEYIRKSAEWLVQVVPSSKIGEINHCLKGFVLITQMFPKIADELHESILRALLTNLPDFNSHERNSERLIDTVCLFSNSFSKNPEFAAEMVRLVRPDIKKIGIRNFRELKRRLKLVMAVAKMAKSQKILEETSQLMTELRSEFEGRDGKWTSATLITIVCDLLNELLILGKNDVQLRTGVEESLSQLLKDLNLSKQNTKEKQAFFNSLAKCLQIVKQLPTESDVKTQIHHIVFNQETGLFGAQNRDNGIFGHNTLYRDLVNLISVLLTPTSLNHLQATYTDLRKIMMESMTRLKQSVENPESDNVRWHESILLLFFSALQGISCAKSSLIVMMGIRPSIFELFTGELPLTEYWLASNHPQVYHLFVTILVGHLKAHDFYVAQSDYLVSGESSMQTIGQTKREYARKQVLALQKIISTFGNQLWKKTRTLISSWLLSLVSTAISQKMRAESFRQKEWVRLRNTVIHHSMLDWNNDSINQTLTLLSPITIWPALTSDVNKDITDKTKKATWKEATTIWEAGDFKTYIKQSMSTVYQIGQERQQKLIVTTSFGAEEFNVVTNFLLKQVVPSTFKKGPYAWMDEVLENLTQGCQNISQDKTEVPVPEAFIEKWDWIINQTANFCIVNKMKTPLGKPMQTFAAFENEIKRLAKEVINRKSSEKKLKSVEDNTPSANPPLKYSVQWLRVHLLLKLVEVLEKLMMSAIYGGSSVFNLTEIPVTARQFFVMNSSSCEVWLNRVYYPALLVAYFNGYYGLVIRFGSNALTHFARQKATDEKMITNGVCTACLMSLSMAVLGEPMEIVGLRRRVREEFGTEMGQKLMEALGEMAQAKYEIALVSLETILIADGTLNETLRIVIQIAMTDMLNRIRLPDAVSYYKKTLFGEDDAQVAEDFRSVEMLTKFEKLNNRMADKRQVVDWSARERLQLVEAAYSQTMKRNELLDLQKDMSAMGSLALSADSSCKLYSDISSSSLVIANLVDRMNGAALWKNSMTELEVFDKNEEGNEGDKLAICRKLMHWGRHMKHPRGQSFAAHGEIIRLSRKTSNSMLAFFHINSAMRNETLNVWQRLEVERQRLKLAKGQDVSVRIQEMNAVFGSLADVFVTSIQLKQSFQMQDNQTQNKMVFEGYMTELSKREEHMSRASIQLGDFFHTLPSIDNVLTSDLVNTMIWPEIESRSAALQCGVSGLIGALFTLAAEMCPTLAKAHLKMAKWAYEMTKIDNFPNANAFPVVTYGHNEQEQEELWKCLETTSIVNLEKQVRKAIPDVMRASALISPHSPYLHLWEAFNSHRRKFLSITVSSYFQFIHNMSGEVDSLPYSKREETTLACLRILELLVKHGEVLIDVINDGLSRTNVHVWKEILPQLFARLSHPSEHIRKTLVDLISRVCTAAPHAVVFQVVSGAASSSEVAEDLEEQQNDDRNRVRACCEQLETKMAQSYPSLVRDVRQFVAELERINLLNEEKWSVVLGTMEHEMEKRLALIRTENAKTEMAMHLIPTMKDEIISKKTKLLTRQIFDVLDELYEQTILEPPKTKNEEEFVIAFSEILTNAHNESKKTRWLSPETSWAPFKNLIANFVHRNIKKGMQQLNTADISPYLATLGRSCVPMPGQESVEFDRVVSIARVSDQVTILPTKTRPKKLGFIGSDGKQVAFLFKGREDLHLDERVMQFLRLCNVMLQPGKGKTRQVAEYQAHHYAVIPLGPRSGLIKWVEGATPMFHIYRKWQVKEKALKQATKKNGETVPDIERPTNMYHNMIREAFTAHKIDSTIAADRSKWPVHVLEEVFSGLCSKTPTDLITRELWMRANDATAWWAVTKRYARSLAVMSMVGSVLGLGDRHLDNLLVDLKYGHVVHIDYNICFDKGKNLRIPETVPFRLSRNMRHALGPSEMYGTFRESCVHVLSTLRSGHQVLTMLLDAFVFDPLVDWTSHEHISTSGGVSLALQLAVYGSNWKAKSRDRLTDTIELFQLRVNELHALWMNNREDLLHWMKQVTDCLLLENSLPGLNGMCEQQKVKAGTELREAVTRHQALAKEFRPLIRAIGKEREEFADYLKFYKQAFIEPLLKGHSALRHNVDIETSVHNFNIVMQNIDVVFMSLVSLSTLPIDSINSRSPQQQFKPPPGLENVWVWKEDQQENSQAREVVRRVERRLNGWLDGSAPDRKLSPREEADVLIAEATSNANLAQMYEGWTAWV